MHHSAEVNGHGGVIIRAGADASDRAALPKTFDTPAECPFAAPALGRRHFRLSAAMPHSRSAKRRIRMKGLLTGRLALVTGAGSGIGEGIARAMAQAGAHIITVDINGEAALRAAKSIGGGAHGFTCDVADRGQCDALADTVRREIGPISVLVNNAGIIRRGTVTDAKARSDWDATLAVNLDGPYNMTTAFLLQLKES